MVEARVIIPVRQLVEFVLRGGSIDNRFGGADRALEGARIHRMLQKAEGEHYRSEVFLSLTTELDGISFTVEGRADGILEENSVAMIDEIKTTAVPLEQITEEFNRVHWAQAMCYGYLYCVKEETPKITIRLTYYQIDQQEVKRFYRTCTVEELKEFYEDLLRRYQVWAKWQAEWKNKRNQTMQELKFPFPQYRRGQRGMAAAVYRTIQAGGTLFCQAPTGIGKTLSAVFPAVKAMGEEQTEKIFYLTAKTITRKAAEDAFARLRECGMAAKTITLTAKDKLCFLEERRCNPEECIYAKGHFDRVDDVILKILHREDAMTREVIETYARQYQVCPFELSLDLSLWCDAVICDYNYLFDPTVSLKRFFSDTKKEYSFLIDEAHNLIDRARNMYSASLKKSDFLSMKKMIGKEEKLLQKSLQKVNQAMITMRKQCGEQGFLVCKEAQEDYLDTLRKLIPVCEEWLKEHPASLFKDSLLQMYFEVLHYLKIADLYDDCYVTLIECMSSEVKVEQMCLNPANLLQKCLKKGRAAILFSATLTPMDYFCETLGGDEQAKRMWLSSPYDQRNLCLMAVPSISTRYRHREASIQPIAQMIGAVIEGKQGNYLVYFPSYQYMNQVFAFFEEHNPQIHIIKQENHMDEETREQFLSLFQSQSEETIVGFCVLGGIFSEGIDLKGERLVGAVIVGVGLPQINRRQELLRSYYDQKNGLGYEFAYQFPGMNKVLQAAGRVIRGEEDRGVVLLIDDRFATHSYRQLFPSHWEQMQCMHSSMQVKEKIKEFWESQNN